MGVLFFEYFFWHYGRAFWEMFGIFGNFAWFFYNFFSVGILTRTLISPIWRLEEKYKKGFDPQALFESLVVNLISRIVGFLLRIVLIISGIISEFLLIGIFLITFAAWIILPVLIPILFIGGLTLLIP